MFAARLLANDRGGIVFLVVLGWAAIRFDWIEKLEPGWERLRDNMAEIFSRETGSEDPEDSPETPLPEPSGEGAPAERSSPGSGASTPSREGRPL